MEGIVIDVKIFTKKGYERDPRSIESYDAEKEKIDREHQNKLLMLDREEMLRLEGLLLNNKLAKAVELNGNKYKKGDLLKSEDVKNSNRYALNSASQSFSKEIQDEYTRIKNHSVEQKKELKAYHEEKIQILEKDDILPSGVTKVVKVYIATKRKLKVGDKMAGRHGNKGIVSNIVPEVDAL